MYSSIDRQLIEAIFSQKYNLKVININNDDNITWLCTSTTANVYSNICVKNMLDILGSGIKFDHSELYNVMAGLKKYRVYNGQIIEDTNASGEESKSFEQSTRPIGIEWTNTQDQIDHLEGRGKNSFIDSEMGCPVMKDWQSWYPGEWNPPKPKCECGTSKVLASNRELDLWERHSDYCPIYTAKVDLNESGKEEPKGSEEDTRIWIK